MMDIEAFTKNLEAEFEDMKPGTLMPDTNYKTIQGWSSMHALIIIAFIDTHFNIILSGTDLRSASSVRDLYNLVIEKSN